MTEALQHEYYFVFHVIQSRVHADPSHQQDMGWSQRHQSPSLGRQTQQDDALEILIEAGFDTDSLLSAENSKTGA